MRERGILESEIDEALRWPETQYESQQDPTRAMVLGSTSAGRRLKVVVLVSDPDYVITVADRDADE